MKTRMLGFLALFATFSFTALTPQAAYADDGGTGGERAVEVFDDANGKVADITDAVYDAVAAAATDDQAREILMNGLEKVGIKGGWAKQLGELNKIKGVSAAFSTAVNLLNAGKTLEKLSAAYQQGDQDAFRNIVADQLTDLAAGLVGKAVGAVIHTVGGAIITAAAFTGPGFIIASGVVLVADWVVSGYVEKIIAEAIRDGTMYESFQQFGDVIWNMIHPGNKDKDTGGPFDGQPENGNGNGPMCPLPGGGTPDGHDRYHGLKPIKLL